MTPIAPREMLDAMVCGLPSYKRNNWLLCMLISHVDDSGSDKQGPVYVLAGYISTLGQWQEFSDLWQIGLDSGPRKLDYFKMEEAAHSGKGQFKNWRKPDRDKKTEELAKIIKSYAMFGVRSVLWWKDFDAVQKRYPEYPANPYVILQNYVMSSAIVHVMSLKIEEKIKFVFDEQGRDGAMAYHAYNMAKVNLPAEMLEYVAGPPSYESDRIVLPLQAADMIAWQSRRFCRDNKNIGLTDNGEFLPVMKFLDDIPTVERTLYAKTLEEFFYSWKKKFPRSAAPLYKPRNGKRR